MKNTKVLHHLTNVTDSFIDSILFVSGIIFTLVLVTLTTKSWNSFKFQRKFSLGTQSGIV